MLAAHEIQKPEHIYFVCHLSTYGNSGCEDAQATYG